LPGCGSRFSEARGSRREDYRVSRAGEKVGVRRLARTDGGDVSRRNRQIVVGGLINGDAPIFGAVLRLDSKGELDTAFGSVLEFPQRWAPASLNSPRKSPAYSKQP
jgi:hypothetical protein